MKTPVPITRLAEFRVDLPNKNAKRKIQQYARDSTFFNDYAYASRCVCKNCFREVEVDRLTDLNLLTCSNCYSEKLVITDITMVNEKRKF